MSNNIINASFIDRQNIYQMGFIFHQISAKKRNAFYDILITNTHRIGCEVVITSVVILTLKKFCCIYNTGSRECIII